jgi:hypothetical protein
MDGRAESVIADLSRQIAILNTKFDSYLQTEKKMTQLLERHMTTLEKQNCKLLRENRFLMGVIIALALTIAGLKIMGGI